MKTFIKILSMIAICLTASIQLSACSSDSEDSPVEKTYNLEGEWGVWKLDPIEPSVDKIDPNDPSYEILVAISNEFNTPYIKFNKDGSMTWHDWDAENFTISTVKRHGSYSVKGDKLYVTASDNIFLKNDVTIESVKKGEITLIVKSPKYKVKVILGPSDFDM